MGTILTLIRKDFANFFRDKTAVSLTFLVPIMLIYIFGQVFGINRTDSGPSGIRLGVVNESTHPGAAKLVEALSNEKAFRVVTKHQPPNQPERPLTEADLRPLMRQGEFRFAVVIPRDLVSQERLAINLRILSNPRNEIESQTVNGLLQRTIFANAPELLGQSLQLQAKKFLGGVRLTQFNSELAAAIANAFGGDKEQIEQRLAEGDFGLGFVPGNDDQAKPADPAQKSGTADLLSSMVNLQTEQVAGQQVKNSRATGVVGGWAMMFLMFALSAAAAAFFDEKKAGLFQRLLAAPVHRSQLLWSRFGYGVILGLVQLTILFFTGKLLYGIDVWGHFGNLVIICIVAAAACTSLGMLLAAVSPSAQAANGLASFVILIMSATGGAWFPVSFMPEFMQHVAKFTIVYWSMEGFSQVLWENFTLLELLPTIGILLAISAGVMGLAIWLFNRSRIFE